MTQRDEFVVPRLGPGVSASGVTSRIFEDVRAWVITGELAQGQRINEIRLATELEVSRVPMREVLPRLEAHGFLTSLPHRSAVVSTWSETRVLDLFDLRSALEPEAARLATIAVSTGATTARLEAALAMVDDAVAGGSRLTIADLDALIHQMLIEVVGSRLLASTYLSVAHNLSWLSYLTPCSDIQRTRAELDEVLDAIKRGKGELAKAMRYRQIEMSRDAYVAAIDESASVIPDDFS